MKEDTYINPLTERYSSSKMKELFSPNKRYSLWRKLWVALAKGEQKEGLLISDEQIKEMEDNIFNIDYELVKKYEASLRHDVMAHIQAYNDSLNLSKGIIHLGATSCFVTDNADLVIYKEALLLVKKEIKEVMLNLIKVIKEYKDVPTLGYTHYQPAQLVTIGKRFSLYLQDLYMDMKEIDDTLKSLKFLSSRGTTGTEASFLELFDNDSSKVDRLNLYIAKEFGFDEIYDVTGQTYPRKVDSRIMHCLVSIGESASKFSFDMRLMQHDRIVEEPYEDHQVGSSAMPYKHNPMRSERISSLSRYLLSSQVGSSLTSSLQWFERTLDDSAYRRISLPESFLVVDSILRIYNNILKGLKVNKLINEKLVNDYLPFIASENLLMEGVKRGGNREELHEIIRLNSNKAILEMKEGKECNLLNLLSAYKEFSLSKEEMKEILKAEKYIGRCKEQVDRFIKKVEAYLMDVDNIEMEDINL